MTYHVIFRILGIAILLSYLASEMVEAKSCAKQCKNPITIACPTITCNVNVVHISQSNVGPTGYSITTSGRYCLIENIVFSPSDPPISAITISASNVELDLNGYTLSQGNTVANANGVTVSGVSEVIVKNGNVESFTRAGIAIDSCERTLAQDLTVVSCGGPANSLGGIVVTNTKNSSVEGCLCDLNVPFGISGAALQDVSFIGNSCTNSTSTASNTLLVQVAAGFYLVDTLQYISGITLKFPSKGIQIRNCNVSGVHNQALTVGIATAGFVSPASMEGVTIENCIVDNLSIDTGAPVTAETVGIVCGFQNDLVVQNCTVTNLTNAAGGQVNGISILTNNALVEDCVVRDLIGDVVSPTAGVVEGYAVETIFGTPLNNIIFRNCSASNVVNTGNAGAYGFKANGPGYPPEGYASGIGFIFDGCTAEGCTGASNTGVGFLFNSMINLTARNNTAVRNNSSGILFQDTAPFPLSVNNLIESNTVIGNTLFGIHDSTTGGSTGASANAYIANIARSNTGSAGPGFNYLGLPPGTPIRIWTLPGAPSATDSNGILDPQLDNMDIRP